MTTIRIVQSVMFVLSLLVAPMIVVAPAAAQSAADDRGATAKRETRVIRVGLPENPPMIFQRNGQPTGFAVDFLDSVAKAEGWTLDYVPGAWPEMLDMLERGEIDLLSNIAYSRKRAELFDFTKIGLINNWGVVLAVDTVVIDSILDLENKRVAAIPSGIYTTALRRTLDQFDIRYTDVAASDYDTAARLVAEGQADAAVVSRIAANILAQDRDIIDTGIAFQPVQIRMATPKGQGEALRAAIDRHLEQQKLKETSAYRRAMERWITPLDPNRNIIWIQYLAGALLIVLLLFGAASYILKREVNRRTAELETVNSALRDREAQVESIIENQADAVVIVGLDGVMRFANTKAEEYLGKPRASLVGHAFGLPVISGETAELELHRGAGGVLPVEMRARTFDFGGAPAVLTVLRDISERKQAEQESERSKKLVDAVLENIADGIVACDADGTLSLFNRATRVFHGLPETPLPPEEWADYYALYMPDGVTPMPTSEIPLFRALNDETVSNVEMVIAAKGAEPRRLFANGQPMYDRHGDKIGAVVSMRDVTELMDAERALKHSEQRFRRAFESAGHGIALAGTDGRWLDVNAKLCEMLGYDRDELLALDFRAVTHPDDLEDDLELVRRTLAGEIESYQLEKRYVRKDGSVFPAMLSVGLVLDEDRQPLHFVSQIADMSALKESEAKYLQAQKMEAVGQLTGGIAHDFNNILGVVLGNLQLVQRKLPEDARMREQIERALNAVARGADLTKRLLAFSRRQQLDPKVIDVGRLVEELLKLIERTLGEEVEIHMRQTEDRWSARIDPGQLENAILNLCVNARDAMPDGGTLTIETANIVIEEPSQDRNNDITPGEYICLSISDTGTGMPVEIQAQIFEPFFTTKETGRGTGLGMSMVFGFVKQSGGYLSVYSEVGVGTTLKIYLPRVMAEAELTSKNLNEKGALPAGNERVLLVDDDKALRETMAALLDTLGYQVLQASNGPEALNVLRSQNGKIDLMFTDVVMPGGMNGAELIKEARKLCPDLPALIQSGFTERALINGSILDENTHFIEKPASDTTVAAKLRELLDA